MSTDKTQTFNANQTGVNVKNIEVSPDIKFLAVSHDEKNHRFFIADKQKTISVVNYELRNKFIVILDTFTEPNYRSMGLAEKVTGTLFKFARENNFRVKSQDKYTSTYLSRHPEDKDIFEGFEDAPTGTTGTTGTARTTGISGNLNTGTTDTLNTGSTGTNMFGTTDTRGLNTGGTTGTCRLGTSGPSGTTGTSDTCGTTDTTGLRGTTGICGNTKATDKLPDTANKPVV